MSWALFPSWETLPHERLSPRADTVGRRLATLRRLAHPQDDPAGAPRVIVTTIRSMIQPMAPDLGELAPVTLKVGDWVDLLELTERLTTLAYTRVDLVEKRGEMAVRGGIVDIFPPTAEHPVRVEFFGDEIVESASLCGDRSAVAGVGTRRVGPGVPGDPAHRSGPGPGRHPVRGRYRRSDAGRNAGQAGRRDRRGGDGGAHPGAVARAVGHPGRTAAAGHPCAAGRSGTDPHPCRRPAPHRGRNSSPHRG